MRYEKYLLAIIALLPLLPTACKKEEPKEPPAQKGRYWITRYYPTPDRMRIEMGTGCAIGNTLYIEFESDAPCITMLSDPARFVELAAERGDGHGDYGHTEYYAYRRKAQLGVVGVRVFCLDAQDVWKGAEGNASEVDITDSCEVSWKDIELSRIVIQKMKGDGVVTKRVSELTKEDFFWMSNLTIYPRLNGDLRRVKVVVSRKDLPDISAEFTYPWKKAKRGPGYCDCGPRNAEYISLEDSSPANSVLLALD